LKACGITSINKGYCIKQKLCRADHFIRKQGGQMFHRKNKTNPTGQSEKASSHPFIKKPKMITDLEQNREFIKKVIADLKNKKFEFSIN